MGLEPISAVVTSMSGVFNYFKPSKSPYLIVLGALGYVLTRTEWQDEDGVKTLTPPAVWDIVMYPVLIAGLVVVILSFYFVPIELKLWQEKSDKEKEAVQEDIENQFKFARSVGVATGILSLYIIGSEARAADIWFYLMYGAALLQLAVFLFYLAIRNFKEEQPAKILIFQIAVMTCAFLLFSTLNFKHATPGDGAILSNCEAQFEPIEKKSLLPEPTENATDDEREKIVETNSKIETFNSGLTKRDCSTASPTLINGSSYRYIDSSLVGHIDWPAVNFLYCLAIWAVYFLFWIVRLRSILKIEIR